MHKIWWGDFKAADFENIDPEETIAILPLAAIEQHGPHLPLSTDASIMEGLLKTVFAQLPENLDVRVLPIQYIGKSDEHTDFSGTLSIDAVTAISHWTDIGESVARAGIRKFVLINAHGGNEAVMNIVALELRKNHQMMVVKTAWDRFGFPDAQFSDDEKKLGIHGGDYETSLMLHFQPHLVDMDKAENFDSRTAQARQTFKHLAPQSPHAFAWLADDLNEAGVVGNAAAATALKGKLSADHQAKGFIELLEDVRSASIDEWIRS